MSVIFVLCLCTCHIYLCATLNRWRSGRIRHQRLEDSPDNQVDSFYRITFPDKQQESVSFDSGIDQYDQTHRQWVLGLPLPSITGDIEAISAVVVREEILVNHYDGNLWLREANYIPTQKQILTDIQLKLNLHFPRDFKVARIWLLSRSKEHFLFSSNM